MIDSNQQPLSSYRIDWGDGNIVSVTGASLRDRIDQSQPYVLAHSYNYYDLLDKDAADPRISCAGNKCSIKPRIQVIDNWGWCNGKVQAGYYGSNCQSDPNAWTEFSGEIKVGLTQ